jgi:hypothetical protein
MHFHQEELADSPIKLELTQTLKRENQLGAPEELFLSKWKLETNALAPG